MVYHVYNKSISGLKIFNDNHEYLRIIDMLSYYQYENPPTRFSLSNLADKKKLHCVSVISEKKLVDIIAYCIMPTHIHLLLMEKNRDSLAIFINKLLISYTRYFNIKYKRKGTIWEGRTKKVFVENDDQLMHLTRYIHLNPVTAYIVNRPEDWVPSSYREYMLDNSAYRKICSYKELISISPAEYKIFVENGISYQREKSRHKYTDAV